MKSKDLELFEIMSEYPDVYESSPHKFWDDEHISKYMLEAHLSEHIDSASRNLNSIKKSVQWISTVTKHKQGLDLLDLGCGPGIYAELLNDVGFNVLGIDISKRSIEYARDNIKDKDVSIKYIHDDYLSIDYKEQFDVVILIYSSFGVLSPKHRKTLLDKAYAALREGGILIMDGWSENYYNNFKEFETISFEEKGFWSKYPYVCIQRNKYYYETHNTLEQYIIISKTEMKTHNIWNQVYSKELLETEFVDSGFKSLKFFDDVEGSTYTGHTDTISIVGFKQ